MNFITLLVLATLRFNFYLLLKLIFCSINVYYIYMCTCCYCLRSNDFLVYGIFTRLAYSFPLPKHVSNFHRIPFFSVFFAIIQIFVCLASRN